MSGYDVISQIFEFTIYKKDLDESISNKEKIIDIVNEKIDNIRCFDFIEYDDCYKLKNTFGVSDIEVLKKAVKKYFRTSNLKEKDIVLNEIEKINSCDEIYKYLEMKKCGNFNRQIFNSKYYVSCVSNIYFLLHECVILNCFLLEE